MLHVFKIVLEFLRRTFLTSFYFFDQDPILKELKLKGLVVIPKYFSNKAKVDFCINVALPAAITVVDGETLVCNSINCCSSKAVVLGILSKTRSTEVSTWVTES